MGLFSLNISSKDISVYGYNSASSNSVAANTNTNISTFGTDIISDTQSPKEPSEMELVARDKGYKPTEIPVYFYDENKDKYFKWDETKNKFVKNGKPQLVLPNGNYIDSEGTYKKVTSRDPYKEQTIAYMDGNNLNAKGVGAQINAHYAFADFYGYQKTAKENIYIKETPVKTENGTEIKKEYVTWNSKTDSFETTNITEILSNGSYTRNGNKYYDCWGNGLTQEKYEAERYGLGKKNENGLYTARMYNIELAEKDSAIKDVYKKYIEPSDPYHFFETEYKWNPDTKTFEITGKAQRYIEMANNKADGIIGDFSQGKIGDCWLLAAIEELANDPKGQEQLKDILKVDENGNATVTLKGAGKIYTITNEEIDNAIKEGRFSIGDRDVMAIEMAFERYRRELIDSKNMSRDKNSVNFTGDNGLNYTEGYELQGGYASNAIAVLTGKKTLTYSLGGFENTIRKNYGNNEEGKLDKTLLEKYINNPNNLIVVALDESSEDDHAYSFDSIEDGKVRLIDPHDTSKIKEISVDDFYQRLHQITITDLSENI